ncbi:NAD(P)-binding protein [Bradyrhizobium sp. WSM 1738]|nr:NAD(P)-binding protein [Bradyrhizobium hereditatis]
MRVAVVGTGISGNAAAWTLSKQYPITVYDRELRPGGHSHTVSIDSDGVSGFIVYNELSYPALTALFAAISAFDTVLASGKTNDYTSPVLSTRAKD